MDYDKKVGEAAWALYENHKKLCDFCNACENLITFLEEHFVCKDEVMLGELIGKLEFAQTRHALRTLGLKVVKRRQRVMARRGLQQ